ncbi:hypothetical protein Smp_053760 [Schistosoma mansoni]|uniref:hypothetical protein n=1 Tax=Schistosoma mansoni TaxID=6183 RepID=UPI0001A63AD3|nr:hypothetical protein Smp_053760 [Schistosoma mansoni]|eukprot:XP_018652539.1 hypothetical protein Smp_053760 [Schistosoma mansoni]
MNDVIANWDDDGEEEKEREVVTGDNVEVLVDDIIDGDFTEDCIDDEDESKLFDPSCDDITVVVIVIANGGGGGDGGWEQEKEEEAGECEIIHVSGG